MTCPESTYSPADSPASPSASPGSAAGRPTSAGSGPSLPDSFAHYDPATCSWRTCQASFIAGLETYSATWPRAGMTRNGIASQRRPLAPLTSVTGSGSWPTLPTPRLCSGLRSSGLNRTEMQRALQRWLTPTVNDSKNNNGPAQTTRRRQGGPNLNQVVYTTPCADDTGHRKAKYSQGGTALSTQAGGPLNPRWVEWLMGFPTGWTDCEDSATP